MAYALGMLGNWVQGYVSRIRAWQQWLNESISVLLYTYIASRFILSRHVKDVFVIAVVNHLKPKTYFMYHSL